jgi:hypothetical protein
VPADAAARIAWLDAQWLVLDQRVDELLRERNVMVAEAARRNR